MNYRVWPPRSLVSVLVLFVMASGAAAAGEGLGDLDEAVGLSEETEASSPSADVPTLGAPSFSKMRWRAYFLLEGAQSSGGNDDRFTFPNSQMSLSADYEMQRNNFVVMDVLGSYEAKAHAASSYINQAGFRGQALERVQYFVGKERNRRSPGLIVSPSDFLFSSSSLPGQREDRNGVWLGRLSYQAIAGSFDLFFLPVQAETAVGLPESNQNSSEAAVRGLYQLQSFDLNVMMGRYRGISRVGFSGQTLVANAYKIYIEIGTQEEHSIYNGSKKSYPVQSLLGVGYEGSQDFTLRFEYFENGQGLNSEEFAQMMRMRTMFPSRFGGATSLSTPFVRQKFLIASLSLPELQKKYNITASGVGSLEDDSALGILRFEYLAGDRFIVGLSQTQISGQDGSQYQYRSFDSQTMADLRFSF